MNRNLKHLAAYLFAAGIAFDASAHISDTSKNAVKAPDVDQVTLAQLSNHLKAHHIALKVTGDLQKSRLRGKLPEILTRQSLTKTLVGYNFIMIGGDEKKPEIIKITGVNGNGSDAVVQLPADLENIPNKAAITSFGIKKEQVLALKPGDVFMLPLPEGNRKARVQRKVKGDLGTESVVADLPSGGQMMVTYANDGSVYGRIYTHNGEYRVREDGHGGTIIFDVEQAGMTITKQHDHADPAQWKTQAIALTGLSGAIDLREAVMNEEVAPGEFSLRASNAEAARSGPFAAAAAKKKAPQVPCSKEKNFDLCKAKKEANLSVFENRENGKQSQHSFLETWKKNATVIDLLVLRDPGISDAAVDFLALSTNQSFIDSKVLIRARVVKAKTSERAFNGDNGDAISDLGSAMGNYKDLVTQHDPGFFDDVNALRNKVGADVVAYLSYRGNNNSFDKEFPDPACGNSVISIIRDIYTRDLYSNPDAAVFSMSIGLVNYGNEKKYLYCDESVFAHELGHVLSLDHDKSALDFDDDSRSFVYAIGYYTGKYIHDSSDAEWKDWETNVGTIMSYVNGKRKPWVFSNPRIDCFGKPCGEEGVADAAKALNHTRHIVAGYRATKIPLKKVSDDAYRESKVVDHADTPLNDVWNTLEDQGSQSSNQPADNQPADQWDGPIKSCAQAKKAGKEQSGSYEIQLVNGEMATVYCAMPEGGWMFIERFVPGDPIDYSSVVFGSPDANPGKTGLDAKSFSIWNAIDWGYVKGEIGVYIPRTGKYASMEDDEAYNEVMRSVGPNDIITYWVK